MEQEEKTVKNDEALGSKKLRRNGRNVLECYLDKIDQTSLKCTSRRRTINYEATVRMKLKQNC